MKIPILNHHLLLLSIFLLFFQCKQDNISFVESQKEELSNDLKESVQSNSSFRGIDYNRCIRYAEEDYYICEKRARRGGFWTFGIIMLLGVGIAVYTRRASILLGALFLGFLIGIMNYGNESKYCKVIVERELYRCNEEYIQQ